MMHMRKTAALLLALLTLVLSLSACHGSNGRQAFRIPESFNEGRQIELTFWAKNDTNKRQTAIYEKAIADFEAMYPNITVNMRLYTDYGKIYNDVITNISTNTTPNICITYPDHIATYLTGDNIVVPLDELMADERFGLGGSEVKFDSPTVAEVIPQFLEECRIGENHYALPYMRSTEACYINKTYVEALGYTLPEVLTWDFVFEVAEAAMEKDADGLFKLNGQKVMIPFIYKSTDNMMIQMLKQKDAGYSTADGEIVIFNDTTKEILLTIASHAKTRAFSTFSISSYPANFLNAGQCLFAVDSTAGATWMGTHAPLSDIPADKYVDFETAVLPIPQFDPENPQMISQGPSVCIFNKRDPQEVLASWLFAQYLISNDVQIAYAETEGYVPVTSKAQSAPEYQDYLARAGEDNDQHYDVKIAASQLLMAHTGDTFVTPVFNGSTSLRSAAGQLIEKVVSAARSKKTADSIDSAYIDSLYSDITALYRLDQIASREGVEAGKAELGPLPQTAVTLLIALAIAWALILVYFIYTTIKKKKALN